MFVDVGCHHPVLHSTTCYLERHLGWSGIGVDALPEYGPMFARERPATTFVHAIVTDHGGTHDSFFRVPRLPGLSATRVPPELHAAGAVTERLRVPATTLDALLEAHGVTAPDFLSIDVEHSELAVLAGFDLTRFRPRLVCIEKGGAPKRIHAYFRDRGYERIERYRRYDPVNWYFRPVN